MQRQAEAEAAKAEAERMARMKKRGIRRSITKVSPSSRMSVRDVSNVSIESLSPGRKNTSNNLSLIAANGGFNQTMKTTIDNRVTPDER